MEEADERTREVLERYGGLHPVTFGHCGYPGLCVRGSARQDADPGVTATPWYASFFGEEYFHIYGSMLSDERTAREVEGIGKLLALPPGSQILDLACGHGRHAIPLAERGYRVTGQDLS